MLHPGDGPTVAAIRAAPVIILACKAALIAPAYVVALVVGVELDSLKEGVFPWLSPAAVIVEVLDDVAGGMLVSILPSAAAAAAEVKVFPRDVISTVLLPPRMEVPANGDPARTPAWEVPWATTRLRMEDTEVGKLPGLMRLLDTPTFMTAAVPPTPAGRTPAPSVPLPASRILACVKTAPDAVDRACSEAVVSGKSWNCSRWMACTLSASL